jgi:DNA-directed RNA polymerase specialized sigma24 family protein
LVATAGFRSDDWEDLRQEMVLDCLRRSQKFDSSRGDWRGFVRGVVRNHATVLVMRERRRAPEILSLDLMNGADVGDTDSLDILDTHPRTGTLDALNLSLDVRRVVERLPDQLQSLARLCGQMPVKDVCEHTGKSRSRIYQMTRQMREAFLRAGYSPSHRKRPSEPAK